MFAFSSSNNAVRVGDRNVEAVKKKLKEFGIRILAEDTGDSYGRTVIFYPENGDFVIRRDEQYGEYVSFVPVSDKVVLSLEGMRYDGVRICVVRGATLCQSNEIVEEEAYIKVHEGVILVFESRD